MSLTIKRRQFRGPGNGVVWPGTGNATPEDIGDVFGWRPFPTHPSGFDFHRGIDCLPDTAGASVYAPIAGAVIRRHYRNHGFDSDADFAFWSETDPSGLASWSRTGSVLRVDGTAAGSVAFGTGVARLVHARKLQAAGDDWDLRLNFEEAFSSQPGAVGIAVYDAAEDEYAAVEYDGATVRSWGADSGGATAIDSQSSASASQTWLRLYWDDSADTLYAYHGTNGTSWTQLASDDSVSWTSSAWPDKEVWIYWRPTDTGSPDDIDVEFVGWHDEATVPRFGNWLIISDGTRKVVVLHHRELYVDLGDWVECGQVVGLSGNTGFDTYSGPVEYSHCHLELVADTSPLYDQDDSINPLRPGFLPRANVDNNVSLLDGISIQTLGTQQDPNEDDCWEMQLVVARADQDFDINEVSLTGDAGTRTVNFDSRTGVDGDNPDYNDVYVYPGAFNDESTSYQIKFFFQQSAVGTAFVSAYVKDTEGTTLFSEAAA